MSDRAKDSRGKNGVRSLTTEFSSTDSGSSVVRRAEETPITASPDHIRPTAPGRTRIVLFGVYMVLTILAIAALLVAPLYGSLTTVVLAFFACSVGTAALSFVLK